MIVRQAPPRKRLPTEMPPLFGHRQDHEVNKGATVVVGGGATKKHASAGHDARKAVGRSHMKTAWITEFTNHFLGDRR
jgi:hypothetical protein